jgi:RNA-directed DNA polymerase
MMHGPQKSDPRIVAEKLSNKPGQLGAETVERRQGAEGNTVKPSMCRTLCRASMSQGLDRVREAAWPDARFAANHPRWEPGA